MDCLQAAEIVASAMDGELVDASVLTEARTHCASCPQCVSLLRVHARVSAAPLPRAPQTLMTALEAKALEAAAEARDAEKVAELLPELVVATTRKRPWYLAPRLVTYGSAAAALLVFAAVGVIALRGGAQKAGDEAGTVMMSEESAPAPTATPEDGAAQDSTEMRSAVQPAPPYLVLNEAVYAQSSVPAPSSLTAAGTVTSDLGTGMTASYPALSVPGTNDPIFIRQADGGYLSFSLVTRTVGRQTYALVSDGPVTSFGEWPRLPADLPQPTSDDGSPAFSRFGFDDRGVDVYVPARGSVDAGFAIAPGTAPGDPAAGNPNWTWWEPIR